MLFCSPWSPGYRGFAAAKAPDGRGGNCSVLPGEASSAAPGLAAGKGATFLLSRSPPRRSASGRVGASFPEPAAAPELSVLVPNCPALGSLAAALLRRGGKRRRGAAGSGRMEATRRAPSLAPRVFPPEQWDSTAARRPAGRLSSPPQGACRRPPKVLPERGHSAERAAGTAPRAPHAAAPSPARRGASRPLPRSRESPTRRPI